MNCARCSATLVGDEGVDVDRELLDVGVADRRGSAAGRRRSIRASLLLGVVERDDQSAPARDAVVACRASRLEAHARVERDDERVRDHRRRRTRGSCGCVLMCDERLRAAGSHGLVRRRRASRARRRRTTAASCRRRAKLSRVAGRAPARSRARGRGVSAHATSAQSSSVVSSRSSRLKTMQVVEAARLLRSVPRKMMTWMPTSRADLAVAGLPRLRVEECAGTSSLRSCVSSWKAS